ncbi:NDP-hexose 2,3-dehydratase family protein [Actinoplanes sp. NBRC 103695]|uniref:NDP-hexose 2,3-dehydratase family protein n=1 Tax=Actinoplanes sp. NBRC 103695 TaxID=3032202 RepID=UPI0024A3C625|nr:NDP-hexose 2,3-dehydratase family protein [Actinoplanes sp. NBRC 103695]GLZ00707.1 hypothetical protein Acsp02_79590 [Actinoplanes sp. NBRC 103695]
MTTTLLAGFHDALVEARRTIWTRAERIPLGRLSQWDADPGSGALRHVSGRFYSIQGIDVTIAADAGTRRWQQPIIVQPEIGVLGILTRRIGGTPHFLMQLKAEPGNINGIQVSPTVQATRSNYTRVHGGAEVPYLEYFRAHRRRVIADVRQSEQGSWFLRKRNRNMIVEVTEDVPVRPGFHWLTLPQLHALLRSDDLVNMDARTVLSCLPLLDFLPPAPLGPRGEPARSLLRSWSGAGAGRRDTTELLSWITEARTSTDLRVVDAPLNRLPHWRYGPDAISHERNRYFDVIGVRIEANGREVSRWDQPMVAARDVGLAAFLVSRCDGVMQVLTGLRVEAGFADVAELAPTVQCTPEHYPPGDPGRPPFLDTVLGAAPERLLYDATLSEEGGRFYRTRNRYVIVEVDPLVDHPDFRWMTLHQLTELVRHSSYLNVQARTLLAALATLATHEPDPAPRTRRRSTPRTPTIAVLGASGYLGSVVCGLLAQRSVRLRPVARRGYEIPAAAVATVEPLAADLTGRDAVIRAVSDADVVLHLAKHSGDWRLPEEDPAATEPVNVGIMRTVLEVLSGRPADGRPPPLVVFAGACTQIGRTPDRPMDGTEPDHPDTEYDRQNLAAERLLMAATRAGTVRGTSLRLATVFGQSRLSAAPDAGVVSTMIRKALAGEPLTMWHDGTVARDITYVEDVARAFLAAIDRPDRLVGRHWLVGTGGHERLGDVFATVAAAVAAATGRPGVPVVTVSPPGGAVLTDFLNVFVDPEPFRSAAGWQARTSLRDGIDRTVGLLLRRTPAPAGVVTPVRKD